VSIPDDLEIITLGQTLDQPYEVEGSRVTWVADRCEIVIALHDLQASETQAVKSGIFELGLNVIEQMPFLCFRIFQVATGKGFGSFHSAKVVLPWQECPLHIARIHPDQLPHFDAFRANPAARLGIYIILTDWPGMTVKALRYFTLSPFLTQKLIDALLSTAAVYTRDSYTDAVNRIFAQYPINSIADASRIRCKSGD
jgi:hypothetical protein